MNEIEIVNRRPSKKGDKFVLNGNGASVLPGSAPGDIVKYISEGNEDCVRAWGFDPQPNSAVVENVTQENGFFIITRTDDLFNAPKK
ncbi:hypothetical protein HY030_01175 [Candidatus Gottesmanbacteria bacterium]|nr:hypothetical protein [Candidatus Gottesmanbacteria bacterium]